MSWHLGIRASILAGLSLRIVDLGFRGWILQMRSNVSSLQGVHYVILRCCILKSNRGYKAGIGSRGLGVSC